MASVEIQQYETAEGDAPFDGRLANIRDGKAVARITAAIVKMQSDLFGDWKAVGGGVLETRIDYGPGYRIYYGKDGDKLVILLVCGDKRSQSKDIEVANDYWQDYKARKQAVQPGQPPA